MSLSALSHRYSTAVTLLQQVSPAESTKKASADTNEILKIANGLSTAPGAAAKHASGIAFNFSVNQAVRDEAARKAAREAGEPSSIFMAGIGGGDAVERFDSWEALESRIRTDGKMDDAQKNGWLEKMNDIKTSLEGLGKLMESDRYLAMKSGAFDLATDDFVKPQLENNPLLEKMKLFTS